MNSPSLALQATLAIVKAMQPRTAGGSRAAARRDELNQTGMSFLVRISAIDGQHKHPGQWKVDANQAGSTLFVSPELVPQTLREAWSMMPLLEQPMQRALFTMFVVSETHPFTDGNGRTSRLLMNACLSQQAQCRIIIPTVFREDYLLSLKAMSHQGDATAYIRSMSIGQVWASELNYDVGVPEINRQLDGCQAKKEDTRVFRLLSPKSKQPMGAELRSVSAATPHGPG